MFLVQTNLEQQTDQLLAVAAPLAGQAGGAHVEEGGVETGRHGPRQHCLPRPRRPKQQDGVDIVAEHLGLAEAAEQLRVAQRVQHALLQRLLGGCVTDHRLPGDRVRAMIGGNNDVPGQPEDQFPALLALEQTRGEHQFTLIQVLLHHTPPCTPWIRLVTKIYFKISVAELVPVEPRLF